MSVGITSRLAHHYAALGIAIDATPEEVTRAWKDAAARWHPDALAARGRPHAVGRFVALGEAFGVLGDPGKRRAYDADLQAGLDALLKAAGQAPLAGIIDKIAGVKRASPEAGRNRRMKLTVEFAEAVRGTERRVELNTEVDCRTCDGQGFAQDGRPWVCQRCAGLGEVLVRGSMRSAWETCGRCHGRGYEADPACGSCDGLGHRVELRAFLVPIEAGSPSGRTLRVVGAGEPSASGGPPGDLLVDLIVESDPLMRLDGRNVRMERPIPFWRALAGGPIEVGTPHGMARIQVPAGSADGEVLRLAGWGVRGPQGGESSGDMLVTLRLEYPATLPDEAKGTLVEWGESLPPGLFPRAERATPPSGRRDPNIEGERDA
jgi:molecular chaperone DnaJ